MSISDPDRTYSMLTGGWAISENLQLDRELTAAGVGEATESLDGVAGITMPEVDWTALIANKNPERDPLAAYVPADQYVLFFPSFQCMRALVEEAKREGVPILRLLESRSEDAETQARYERQLCLSFEALTPLQGVQLVRSAAFTGSDPYLRTGSDVAVLFEARNPEALRTLVDIAHFVVNTFNPCAEKVSGTAAGVAYTGVVSPDRAYSSYLAVDGDVVVVSNSTKQLERLFETRQGGVLALDGLPEYAFFRDRYKRGDNEETALLIATDAAIRKWCGPRWRIGASRRTRVAAGLAELQARHLEALASGKATEGPLPADEQIPGAGEMRLTRDGVVSSIYGSLEFLTPIAELEIDRATRDEIVAYERFRNSYQNRWRVFDPIAVRFTVRDHRIATDLTVRPLIAGTRYRDFRDICGNMTLSNDRIETLPDAVATFAIAFDLNGEFARIWNNCFHVFSEFVVPPVSWVGNSVTFEVLPSERWKTFGEGVGVSSGWLWRFVEVTQMPVACRVAVADQTKLTGALVSFRALIENFAFTGQTFAWDNVVNKGRRYVRIRMTDNPFLRLPEDFQLLYSPTPDSLVVSPNEDMLKRILAMLRKQADAPRPGTGESVHFSATSGAREVVLGFVGRQMTAALERRSWSNLPILNEWRRRFGAEDPVAFHEKYWRTRLTDPAGGRYVWNEEFQTMESTVFGCPARPLARDRCMDPFPDVDGAEFGLTFEDDGIRARVQLTRAGEEKQ